MPNSCSLAAPGQTPDRPTVLVIQLARLGDFLQTTPLLAALRQGRPDAELAVMVTPEQAPLARRCPSVDAVVVIKRAEMAMLAGQSPADAAQLARLEARLASLRPGHIYSLNMSLIGVRLAQAWPRAALAGWRLSADGKGMVGEPWYGFMMNMVHDRRLTRHHLSDLLASLADPPRPAADRLQYVVGQRSRQRAAEMLPPPGPPLVALQLGANSDLRRWPVDSFAALAKGLLAMGVVPVLVGARGEAALGQRLLTAMGPAAGAVSNLIGKTDLPTLAAVLERCALVVAGDTGTLHLASAVTARTLSLFMGPAQVHETGPYGHGHLVLQARDVCGPCQEQTPVCGGAAQCRRLIGPDEVLAVSRALLDGASARQAVDGLGLSPGVLPLEGLIDRFGQRYRPLRSRALERPEALALALREAGRVLLRSAYEFQPAEIAAELAAEHLPASERCRAELAHAAQAAQALAQAAKAGQPVEAKRIAETATELRPLSALVGKAPARLAQACQAAAETLLAVAQR